MRRPWFSPAAGRLIRRVGRLAASSRRCAGHVSLTGYVDLARRIELYAERLDARAALVR